MAGIDLTGWTGDVAAALVFLALVAVPALMIPACQRLIACMEAEGR